MPVLPTQLPDFNFRPMQPQGMGVLRPPAPNPPPPPPQAPFVPAAANPQPRELTPEEWSAGRDPMEIARHITRDLGGFKSMTPEARDQWVEALDQALDRLPQPGTPEFRENIQRDVMSAMTRRASVNER